MPSLRSPDKQAALTSQTDLAPNAGADIGALFDALIDAAPALIGNRRLFQSLDWKKAEPDQIRRLFSRLQAASKPVPLWFLSILVVAGHPLPEQHKSSAARDILILNALNPRSLDRATSQIENVVVSALARELCDLADLQQVDPDIAAAAVKRLRHLRMTDEACRLALATWQIAPQGLRSVRSQLDHYVAKFPIVRARIAGVSTTEPFAQALLPAFALHSQRVEAREAEFGTIVSELLQPVPGVDVLMVMLDPLSLLDRSWRTPANELAGRAQARLNELSNALEHYAVSSPAQLVLNTVPHLPEPDLGYVDTHHPAGVASAIRRFNAQLSELASRHANIRLVDTDLALASLAPAERFDERMWFVGRIAFSGAAAQTLAQAFADAYLADKVSSPVKVVAIDFDNTLWGGVFGDDGVEHLVCGDDAPGNAFKAFQNECLRLKSQGKLLVALSKNNPDAISAFSQHPDMLLRKEDFAATAINWQPKPENIAKLAKELNLGLDSFLFLDDSPHERDAMRRMCPQVFVPEMPADPAERPSWLRSLRRTWSTGLTSEDAARTAMYIAERKARSLQEKATSYEDYLMQLGQILEVEPLTTATLPRVAQLHQRTNQFNTTTRRYTETDLSSFLQNPQKWCVFLARARDRFGDHGIIAASVVRVDELEAKIESFVMSCRVLARQIETAFLGAMIEQLTDTGVQTVNARYLPTAKNGLVQDLYPSHGFEPDECDETEGEGTTWTWRAQQHQVPNSAYVDVRWRHP